MNAVGIGSFFNLMNFGQIYGFHIVLFPLFVVLLVAGHLLQVRIRGVVRPFAPAVSDERAWEEEWGGPIGPGWSPWTAWAARRSRRRRGGPLAHDQAAYYEGLRTVPYDLLREGLVALILVAVMAAVFAGFFSSPDDPPLTIQEYAHRDPVGFLKTSLAELSGTSTVATYGPPYNQGSGSVQSLGPLSLQKWAGVTFPIDTADVYILRPLSILADVNPSLARALREYGRAPDQQRAAWEHAYTAALAKAAMRGGAVMVPAAPAGPLPALMAEELTLGQSGALDGLLLRSGGFYQDDFTRPLLFLSEDALPAEAGKFGLLPTQWGMMNETGNYPGQAWLWLYTFWYQVPPFNTSPNADAYVMAIMAVLTLALIMYPYLPYLNRLPYYLGIHRFIWRPSDLEQDGSR
jgi:hypothetical protein